MAKKKSNKMTCRKCGKEKVDVRDFYSTPSQLYNTVGRIDVCKECIQERYNELLTIYGGKANDAFRHLLMNFDIHYCAELYEKSSTTDNLIGEYMRLVNQRKETRDKTSMNNTIDSIEINDVSLEDGIISMDLIDFWGEGYSAREYTRLEKSYKKYSEHYPNKRLQEQEIIKQLCELEIMKENCRRTGDRNGYDKISTQIRKTMEDLRVLPKQAEEEQTNNLGYIIELIEYNEPIPMKHKEFDDVNGIEKLIERTFIRPFKRVFGLKDRTEGDSNED
jgi:hypothetical protein